MKFNAFFIVIVTIISFFSTSSFAIEIKYEDNPNILLSGILGPGGQGSSPWISGSDRGIGTYTNNSNLWDVGGGIVLSSGDVGYFGDGPNTSASWSVILGQPGDNDLTDLSGYLTYDASKFGFDFTASSDSISFDFVFCSEEFDEYVNSGYNDVFGVWLEDSSGNKSQISFDDNNNPITINRAWMSGGNPPNNSTGTELDGCTVPLRTTASVARGQNYRIKFSIADASDAIYDSTVNIGNFKGASPLVEQKKMYGLFIGYRQTSDKYDEFRGDLSAQKVKNSFLELNNVVYSQLVTGDMSTGGIPQSQIESAINEVKSKMKDGDTLFLYIVSHGARDLIGPETTATYGDEVLKVGPHDIGDDDYLTDDELYLALKDIDGINKWVIIDACESGGFWGNKYSHDEGDLEKLKNIYFMAAAEEGKDGYYLHDGITILANAIENAMAHDAVDRVLADSNKDGILSFEELLQWVKQFPQVAEYDATIVGKLDLGDPVLFSLDMWTPVGYKNIDFETNLYPLVNPNPDTDPTGNHSPSASAGPDQTVERTSATGAAVTLDGSGSSDPDGDALTYAWTWSSGSASGVAPTVTLSMGLTTITLTVSDGEASSTDAVDINVVDTTAPIINSITATPNVLRPPNHKMKPVMLNVSASDNSGSKPICKISSVSSNEPVNGLGDGDTAPDWLITGDLTLNLRAERSGMGSGRIYTITTTCTDISNNSSTKTVSVSVPHNM